MGEYAEMMLDGTLCECCGDYIGDSTGFPGYCSKQCASDRGMDFDENSEQVEKDAAKLQTPLFISGDGWIVNAYGKILADGFDNSTIEELEEIVRRVNAHDALVSALSACLPHLRLFKCAGIETEEQRTTIKQVKEALRK